MEFNKDKVSKFRDDFEKAVEGLEKQYGCVIELGTIRYESNQLRAKMTARIGEKIEKLTSSDFRDTYLGILKPVSAPVFSALIEKLNNNK